MSHEPPPGWNPPPPQGPPGGGAPNPWAQPAQQPGWNGAAQPQAWAPPAAPAQGGFGQAPAQPAWPAQPAAPAPGGFGQGPAQPGWQGPAAGVGGTVGFGAPAAPPKDVGLFDNIPCPHCGSPMTSSAGAGGVAGRMVGGLVGWLVVTALASEYYCHAHGQVPKSALPPAHQSVVTTRKIAMLGGAAALLVMVFGCVIFSSVLSTLR